MKIFRGFRHPAIAPACALTIGNFDGVHRGHQAMLALLHNEAQHRGVVSCVLTFEPHPRDYFAGALRKPELAPARIGTLRDKLTELARCGVQQTVVLPFDARLAAQSPQAFIDGVLLQGLGARYVLVGDDFRFGRQRAGDYALLDAAGRAQGFEVARMNSYEVSDPHGSGPGLRVSSSAVREALAAGRMDDAARLLGRPYSISGHVVHGRKLGRALGASSAAAGDGFRTLNLRFAHWKPAASGIFAVLVHGLGAAPLPGVANLGIRPSIDPQDVNGGRVLLETHCLEWPAHLGAEGAYGKIIRVELLHKLHDELKYDSLGALTAGIARDCADARAWFAAHAETRRQTTRDRI
ncbi:riboflavin biosynthesis protein RibF [Acidovorax sp. SRB_14]|uniref:bifunctional riboflavin kinase/FAD synthetase n=1 Tax=unclassified Acidovorax TaxID=2684926 RepID=UPI00145E40BA|nr:MULTISPECIES: bifunctional riboflavin kinase/FAD synthetase [unclassified Acidovorax]NMM75482.1 riboflavin biosynthesis protein RibF [Acidovorax sp. SRB_24]NMM80378.1 riboflavin biosynthesis protein RibF [Acidovorax sp. SRB_14]NMM84999.1 riboflavin biosynthesis protein RibF [Rhodococcus sp. SRB_17]